MLVRFLLLLWLWLLQDKALFMSDIFSQLTHNSTAAYSQGKWFLVIYNSSKCLAYSSQLVFSINCKLQTELTHKSFQSEYHIKFSLGVVGPLVGKVHLHYIRLIWDLELLCLVNWQPDVTTFIALFLYVGNLYLYMNTSCYAHSDYMPVVARDREFSYGMFCVFHQIINVSSPDLRLNVVMARPEPLG